MEPINNPALREEIRSDSGNEFFGDLLPRVVQLGLIIGAVIFFFMLLLGAIQWIFSGGDKAAVETARGRITNAIIGLVILLSVFAVAIVLETFFGIDILELDLGPLEIGGSASVGPGAPPGFSRTF